MENHIDQNIQSQIPFQGGQMPPFAPIPPQMGMPMSRRARWGKQLMAGKAFGFQTLPDWFATYAVAMYAIALLGVSFINSAYAMDWYFWLFGIIWVTGFFFLSTKFSIDWNEIKIRKAKVFEKKLFITGLVIRTIYVFIIYAFYQSMTGRPHEFQGADSISYIEFAGDWCIYWENGRLWTEIVEYAKTSFSDMGYPLFILLPLRWLGEENVVMPLLLLNALMSSYMNVIVYRLTRRTINEPTARIAAIFCMLHPVFICYTGMTLKESLMTMLLVLFIDFADQLLRNRKYTFATVFPVVAIGISLFMFRTVLGMIAFMSVFFALVMIDSRIVGFGRKFIVGVILAGVLLMAVSEDIMREIDAVTQTDVRQQQQISMSQRYGTEGGRKDGNAFAKYAGTAVFAPLIFTIPFPTMVNATEGQEDMQLIHGGNWMRNVMSGFVILAMFMLLLSGDWRKYTLPLAMLLGYLLMLAFTEFAHSLRFHIPVMPFEMMFAAYAITNMRKKHRVWYMVWCMFMVVACFAWNWFKLAGRALS